jgi:glycogen debranching enzyme
MSYARYVQWTGDLEFARKMWPTAAAILAYLGEETGEQVGYITYGGTGALSNQGWKDSGNCIVYANGELAKGPIAVCEAQGYLYAAWREVAAVAAQLGFNDTAKQLTNRAEVLKEHFNRDYWLSPLGTVALALDGEGRQCDVVASNAGHLLGTGILPPDREKLVAERLMQKDMFSGWGIRTLAESAVAYDPMDYQVGAVWPHDNGMIAHGMCKIGSTNLAHDVIKAMLDVALSQSDMRLPELFAGFSRGQEKQPVPYQVACIPQLWAAGCAFHMVAGLLGLSYDAEAKTLTVTKPSIPAWLGQIKVDGLTMGDAEVNLTFTCTTAGATTAEITRVKGNIRCLVEC